MSRVDRAMADPCLVEVRNGRLHLGTNTTEFVTALVRYKVRSKRTSV